MAEEPLRWCVRRCPQVEVLRKVVSAVTRQISREQCQIESSLVSAASSPTTLINSESRAMHGLLQRSCQKRRFGKALEKAVPAQHRDCHCYVPRRSSTGKTGKAPALYVGRLPAGRLCIQRSIAAGTNALPAPISRIHHGWRVNAKGAMDTTYGNWTFLAPVNEAIHGSDPYGTWPGPETSPSREREVKSLHPRAEWPLRHVLILVTVGRDEVPGGGERAIRGPACNVSPCRRRHVAPGQAGPWSLTKTYGVSVLRTP